MTGEQVSAFCVGVGDVIECEVQNPFQQTLRVQLSTPEACAYGNELIAAGRWRKVETAETSGAAAKGKVL